MPSPSGGSAREQLAFLVRYAVLAPSGHNTQPWRFVLSDTHVDVVADMSRALRMVDPHDREMTMSCAAAAETLLAALRAFGLTGTLMPQPLPPVRGCDRPRHAAADAARRAASTTPMLNAIATRRTVRRAYAETAVPAELQALMRETARPFGVELGLFEDAAMRDAVAELVVDADHIQFADPRFRDELASWMHPLTSPAGDGLAGPGFGLPDWATRVAAALMRTFDLGSAVARMDKPNVLGAPLLGRLLHPRRHARRVDRHRPRACRRAASVDLAWPRQRLPQPAGRGDGHPPAARATRSAWPHAAIAQPLRLSEGRHRHAAARRAPAARVKCSSPPETTKAPDMQGPLPIQFGRDAAISASRTRPRGSVPCAPDRARRTAPERARTWRPCGCGRPRHSRARRARGS